MTRKLSLAALVLLPAVACAQNVPTVMQTESTAIGYLPMASRYANGSVVYRSSKLQDTGTQLLYNGLPLIGGGVTGGSCLTGQVVTAISAAGVPTCVATSAAITAASVSTAIAGQSGCTGTNVWSPGTNTCTALATLSASGPLHVASGALTIDTATDAQTGVISASDHSALMGISPMGLETAPGDTTGLHNLFASPARCPVTGTAVGCAAYVPPSYTFNGASSGYGTFGWQNSGFSGPGQSLISRGRGQFRLYANSPVAASTYDIPTALDVDVAFQYGSGSHTAFSTVLRETSPTLNNGPLSDYGAVNAQSGWGLHSAQVKTVQFSSAGISQVEGYTARKPSPGDFNDYRYKNFYGGLRSRADEGTQMSAGHLTEANSQWKGKPTSKSGDTVNTTTLSGGYSDLGEGMRAVDLTPSSQIWSGYVAAHSHFYDLGDAYGTGVYELFTLASGTVTPSKYCVTLDAAIDVPTIPSTNDPATGSMNTVTTSTTFNVTIGAQANCGPGTGTPAAGDYLTLGQPFWEVVQIASVTTLSTGHWAITAPVRLFHRAGQDIWESSYGGAGIAFAANTATNANTPGGIADSAGIPYYNEVVGYPDSTHAVAVKYVQGHLNDWEADGFGNIEFQRNTSTISSMSNTGGVVTALVYDNQMGTSNRKYGYPAVTFANVPNAAFNGPCTNWRNYQYNSQSQVFQAQCDQPGSTGQTQGYTTGVASMAFGTSIYGNSQATIAPMASILDIQTYPSYPGCYATGCVPYVGGSLRLGANKMPLPTDGTGVIAAVHDYAMQVDYNDNYMQVNNPIAFGHHSQFNMTGPGINGGFQAITIVNGQSYTQYDGFGGNQTEPLGVSVSGLFGSHFKAANAPARSGYALYEGCPFTGCGDTAYTYNLLGSANAAGTAVLAATPGTNLMAFGSFANIGTTTWKFGAGAQLRIFGIAQASESAIASAATIAPVDTMVALTAGAVTAISTITVPSACNATTTPLLGEQTGATYGCQITLLPQSSGMTLATGGNIASPVQMIQGQAVTLTFDPKTSLKWQPSSTNFVRTGTAANTDLAGVLTIAGGATTSSSYTFTNSYTSIPICSASLRNTAANPLTVAQMQSLNGILPTISTTGLSFTVGTAPTATLQVPYVCTAQN